MPATCVLRVLRTQHFFRNLGTIMMFAVLGTLVSTFVVGYLVYLFGVAGLVAIDVANPMEALMFGALISAVDPVATLSIMGSADLRCDPLLYRYVVCKRINSHVSHADCTFLLASCVPHCSLVFGESVLNDAVSIVLFRTFLAEYRNHEQYTATTLPSTIGKFALISSVSISVGALIGLSCSFLFKHTRMKEYPKYEISLLFLFAYGSYAFAEAIGQSVSDLESLPCLMRALPKFSASMEMCSYEHD